MLVLRTLGGVTAFILLFCTYGIVRIFFVPGVEAPTPFALTSFPAVSVAMVMGVTGFLLFRLSAREWP